VLDARDAKPPPRSEVKAHNVVILLFDDVGFAASFGGPINMTTLNGNEFGYNLPNGACI